MQWRTGIPKARRGFSWFAPAAIRKDEKDARGYRLAHAYAGMGHFIVVVRDGRRRWGLGELGGQNPWEAVSNWKNWKENGPSVLLQAFSLEEALHEIEDTAQYRIVL